MPHDERLRRDPPSRELRTVPEVRMQVHGDAGVFPRVEPVQGLRFEKIIMPHPGHEIAPFPAFLVGRGQENKFVELDGVETLAVPVRDALAQVGETFRRVADFVGVVVHEPVGVDARQQPFLETHLLGQVELAAVGLVHDAEHDAAFEEILRDGAAAVLRAMVDQAHVHGLRGEVFERAREHADFVAESEQHDDAHGWIVYHLIF